MIRLWYREQHSADWSKYIERVGDHLWLVFFQGRSIGPFCKRENARIVIRWLKEGNSNG
jgi:hypothetical protein